MRKLLFAAMFLLAACSKQSAPAAPALAPVLKSVYFETGSSTIRPPRRLRTCRETAPPHRAARQSERARSS